MKVYTCMLQYILCTSMFVYFYVCVLDMVYCECGRDTGGVTRELWRLLGYSIVGLCEGQPNNLVFRHDSQRVSRNARYANTAVTGQKLWIGFRCF